MNLHPFLSPFKRFFFSNYPWKLPLSDNYQEKRERERGKGKGDRRERGEKTSQEAGKLCFVREKKIKRNQPSFKGRISIIAL